MMGEGPGRGRAGSADLSGEDQGGEGTRRGQSTGGSAGRSDPVTVVAGAEKSASGAAALRRGEAAKRNERLAAASLSQTRNKYPAQASSLDFKLHCSPSPVLPD